MQKEWSTIKESVFGRAIYHRLLSQTDRIFFISKREGFFLFRKENKKETFYVEIDKKIFDFQN